MVAMLGLLFAALLMGGMYMMLAFAYESTEAERAKEPREHEAVPIALTPRFFAAEGEKAQATPSALDDAVLERIQMHVAHEQTLVDRFVSQPSVENLYRDSGGSALYN